MNNKGNEESKIAAIKNPYDSILSATPPKQPDSKTDSPSGSPPHIRSQEEQKVV
jgi:hypothetical protein